MEETVARKITAGRSLFMARVIAMSWVLSPSSPTKKAEATVSTGPMEEAFTASSSSSS